MCAKQAPTGDPWSVTRRKGVRAISPPILAFGFIAIWVQPCHTSPAFFRQIAHAHHALALSFFAQSKTPRRRRCLYVPRFEPGTNFRINWDDGVAGRVSVTSPATEALNV